MQVSADVSESDIGLCRMGQPVRFTVDAYPEQVFRGTISQIRLNATVNQNVVTYPVIIDVPNPDLSLRPNMTANVTIDVATVEDVLRVRARCCDSVRREADAVGGGARGARPAGPGLAAGAPADRSAGSKKERDGDQTVYTIAPDSRNRKSSRSGRASPTAAYGSRRGA
jgi:HlyD family secretion protein